MVLTRRRNHVRTGSARASVRLPERMVAVLTRIDDDPVLLCECGDGAEHTCG